MESVQGAGRRDLVVDIAAVDVAASLDSLPTAKQLHNTKHDAS